MKILLKYLLVLSSIFVLGSGTAATSSDSIHSQFDQLLMQHVDNGKVDYPAIKSDSGFSEYLEFIAEYDPDQLSTREEKLAFWINAYNALAIKGIIDGRSPRTLFGRYGYFKSAKYQVGQRSINLYDLEHEIIIPLGEPRIHFAIVCASLSCPALRAEAYIAGKVDQQLDDNATRFINNPKKNSFESKKIYVSRIFEWFEKDFSDHSGTVQQYLAQYVQDPSLAQKLKVDELNLGFLAYNWRLNGSQPTQ